MGETGKVSSRALERERRARKAAEQLLETKSRELYDSQQALRDAYAATIEVFASFVGGRGKRNAQSMRNIARLASALGEHLELSPEQKQNVYLGALLCDLGKLTLPDHLLAKSYAGMSLAERDEFETHPVKAYTALVSLPPLVEVAEIVLKHCELVNGRGYPNRCQGDEIPLPARIVGLCKDFDGLICGAVLNESLTETEARQYIITHAANRYGESLVESFCWVLDQARSERTGRIEERLTPASLEPGMTVTRDLLNEAEVLVLPAGRVLDEATIARLQQLVKYGDKELLVYVARKALPITATINFDVDS